MTLRWALVVVIAAVGCDAEGPAAPLVVKSAPEAPVAAPSPEAPAQPKAEAPAPEPPPEPIQPAPAEPSPAEPTRVQPPAEKGPVQFTPKWAGGLKFEVAVETTVEVAETAHTWRFTYQLETFGTGGGVTLQRTHYRLPREQKYTSAEVYDALALDGLRHMGDLVVQPDGSVGLTGAFDSVEAPLRHFMFTTRGTPARIVDAIARGKAQFTAVAPLLMRAAIQELAGRTVPAERVPCDAPGGCVRVEIEGGVLITDPTTLIPRRLDVAGPGFRTSTRWTLAAPAEPEGGGLKAGLSKLLGTAPPWVDERRRRVKVTLEAPDGATEAQRAAAQAVLVERLAAIRVEGATIEATERGWQIAAAVGATQRQLLERVLTQRGELSVALVKADVQANTAGVAFANAPPEKMNELNVVAGHLQGADRALVVLAMKGRAGEGRVAAYERVREGDQAQWRAWVTESVGAIKLGRAREAALVDDPGSGKKAVRLTLQPADGEAFHTFTKAHVREQAALMLDDEVLMVPRIMEPIAGGVVQISGADGIEAYVVLAAASAAPLPWPLELKSLR